MSDIVYLSYMPERKAFGVKEEKIKKLRSEGKNPQIKIAPKDWKKYNQKYAADKSNPMVAFLLGREDGYYLMMENYVKALAFINVNLKVLTHEDMVSELDDVCGLILPGRLDDPLNTFANPNLPKKPVLCSLTYVNMVREAEKRGMPILGIGAGAKIIGRLHGLRPKRAIEDDRAILRVKSLKLLNVFPESVLYRIMGMMIHLRLGVTIICYAFTGNRKMSVLRQTNTLSIFISGWQEKLSLSKKQNKESFYCKRNRPKKLSNKQKTPLIK